MGRRDSVLSDASPRWPDRGPCPVSPSSRTSRSTRRADASIDAARARRARALMAGETMALHDALGRITAEPVWAAISSPHYHGAAMDGVAVRAVDTLGASESQPLRLALGRQAHWVDTGDPLPEGTDAVIMLEHLQQIGDQAVEIMAAVPPWQHVRPMGEDIVATELVLPARSRPAPGRSGRRRRLRQYRRSRCAAGPAWRSCPPAPSWFRPSPDVKPGRDHRVQLADPGRAGDRVGRLPERLPGDLRDRAALRARLVERRWQSMTSCW